MAYTSGAGVASSGFTSTSGGGINTPPEYVQPIQERPQFLPRFGYRPVPNRFHYRAIFNNSLYQKFPANVNEHL